MSATKSATKDQMANYLISGYWSDTNDEKRRWGHSGVLIGFDKESNWSQSEKDSFLLAAKLWGDLTPNYFLKSELGNGQVSLKKTNDDNISGRTIPILGNSTDVFGYKNISAANVLINTNKKANSDITKIGKSGFFALVHELGHVMGLGHSGNYNNKASYENDAIYNNDTQQWTVMSYFSQVEAAGGKNDESTWFSQTPMLYDIYSVQKIYGKNIKTRVGDTVYGFNAKGIDDNSENAIYDFKKNVNPIITIWDAGGSDVLDLSGYSTPSNISLVDGTYSDANGMKGNIGIAYDAIIESAVGGVAADTISGNVYANYLSGGDGGDTIFGNNGNDVIFGNRGKDLIYGNIGSDRLYGGQDSDTIYGGQGDDYIYGDEGNDGIFGDSGNDFEEGGSGNDILFGGENNDSLNGGLGNDTLFGGKGDDVIYVSEGVDDLHGDTGKDTFWMNDIKGYFSFNADYQIGDSVRLNNWSITSISSSPSHTYFTITNSIASNNGFIDIPFSQDHIKISGEGITIF